MIHFRAWIFWSVISLGWQGFSPILLHHLVSECTLFLLFFWIMCIICVMYLLMFLYIPTCVFFVNIGFCACNFSFIILWIHVLVYTTNLVSVWFSTSVEACTISFVKGLWGSFFYCDSPPSLSVSVNPHVTSMHNLRLVCYPLPLNLAMYHCAHVAELIWCCDGSWFSGHELCSSEQ